MGNTVVTKHYHGNSEVSETEYEKTFDCNSSVETTETDFWGRERFTKKDCFPFKRTYTDSGFKEETSDGLAALGAVAGGVFGAAVLAGAVVYGAGKLIYRIATIEKRKKEKAAFIEWQKEYEKTYFAENVEKILSRYNRKLSEYKELLDLGILTEQEYDTYVKDFIKLSNQEIDHAKKYMESCIERLEKK